MRIGEAAKVLGISVQTLRLWERLGKIRDHKCQLSGQRHYDKADLDHIKALMGRGPKYSSHNTPHSELAKSKNGRTSHAKLLPTPPKPPLHDWEALYNLNDSEFWDWYHSKTEEEQASIIKAAPEYLIYHIMRARSTTSRPEENSDVSMGIMPPE